MHIYFPFSELPPLWGLLLLLSVLDVTGPNCIGAEASLQAVALHGSWGTR